MAIIQRTMAKQAIYLQTTTKNQSFINMHNFLVSQGVQNNSFMLILYDRDLMNIDPYDPRLNVFMKQKILKEVIINYMYFIREVVRIPTSGSAPVKYELTRGNLALTFCTGINLNVFLELPRQQGKTVSAICRYLWLYMYGTRSSEINFLNKKMEDSKLNLARFKEIKEALPYYLQVDRQLDQNGMKIKVPNTVEKIENAINRNKIRAVPSANNKAAAASLIRGRTTPLVWADEYGFINYNDVIYTNMVPAFKTAADNARRSGAPYGILITTTPGFLTTDCGKEAYELKNAATTFSEKWYDMPYPALMDLLSANTKSNFVYIRFTYIQLGKGEDWFKQQCIEMRNKWTDIRREILLEWSDAPENSPFKKEDLETIARLVRQPIEQVMFLGKYTVNIYERLNFRYPPIMGVDVSGGFNRDSSAITVIESYSTRVAIDFNCNYISTIDLANLIYEMTSKFLPKNTIINIERNGGFGSSVIAKLKGTSVKQNLYYEIKDKVVEERVDGLTTVKRTAKTKVFGLDSTKNIRDKLMEILRERVEYHKDKIISQTLLNELKGLEVKRNGRIDHGENTHDDSIFSWLMALYVYYEAKDGLNTWGIQRVGIKTDQDLDETITEGLDDSNMKDITEDIGIEQDETVQTDIQDLMKAKGMLFNEWLSSEKAKDDDALARIISTKLGKKAYANTFNEPIQNVTATRYSIPNSVFNDFYEE